MTKRQFNAQMPPPPPRPGGAKPARTPQQPERAQPRRQPTTRAVSRRRLAAFTLAVLGGFGAVGTQLARLGVEGQGRIEINVARTGERSFARPDIVDRNGRLLATDIVSPALAADPVMIGDPDAVALELANHLPGINVEKLRAELADTSRRFVWVRRGLTPAKAQELHNLGLRGLNFRPELRRVYPAGRSASQILGTVSIDNIGTLGVERYIDDKIGVDAIEPPGRSTKPALALSIDLAAQHALRAELEAAMKRYESKAAAGLVMDAKTGEVVAATSLPDYDPNHSVGSLDPEAIDRLTRGRFELGSVFKVLTVGAILDQGETSLESIFDASTPIDIAGKTIRDDHPQNRPLSLSEVFIKSSNVGAARMVEALGPDAFKAFLGRLGLLDQMSTELGPMTPPDPPETWDVLHTMTASFGHGIAVAPAQFTAAVATLVNGGHPVYPTFLRLPPGRVDYQPKAVIRPETSALVRSLLRLNVTSPAGTGRRAGVPGFSVGGKTGTAEIPTSEGYSKDQVISSFVGIFPSDAPRYVTFVMLFEPHATEASGNNRGAGRTAAPTTARIIERLAPILGIAPTPLSGDM